jgi:DNA-binding CsgD family transcriptional regulator
MRDSWPKGFDSETIASIQTIQDSLASLSALYLAVLDGAGAPLTIPSNQAGRCTECQARFTEVPCQPNFRQAVADAVDSRATTQAQCPFGLTTYYSPLGTLGSPSRGPVAAILAIGKLAAAEPAPPPARDAARRPPAGLAHANVEKVIATFAKIFDLVFSLAAHTGGRRTGAQAPSPAPASPAGLSPREREVLHMVSLGLSNRAVAERLFISETTVKTHVHNISRKVKISNRTSLALFFLQSM